MSSSEELSREWHRTHGYGRLERLFDVDETQGPPYAARIDRMSVQRVLVEIGKAIIEEMPSDDAQ